MRKLKLSNTDLSVSEICLGTAGFGAKIDKETAFLMLDRFTDAGGNFVDTASIYARDKTTGLGRSETILGEYIRERGKGRLTVATKGAHYDLDTRAARVNRAAIEADLDNSLRLLGLDTIDFYWLHRDDESLEIEEIVDILERLVRAGKIRYYGGSNYRTERMARAKRYAESIGAQGFSALSNYWTPLKENEGHPMSVDTTLVTCQNADLGDIAELGLAFLPYTSTAKGWVSKGPEAASEKLNLTFDNENNRLFRRQMVEKARKEDCPTQTALLRHMREYGDSMGLQLIPITACSRMEQLEELIKI